MNLQILWITLIVILFAGFFVLEGFDYGVGILSPFLGKSDSERRLILNAIGPFWDGNEVWLIAAGGAIFAAFPDWYATMFSGFYLEMFLVLFALILRGASIEFRSLQDGKNWRKLWDTLFFVGSLLPGFLWGVIVANLLHGVPIDAKMNYAGTILTPFTPFAILCGLAVVVLFALHGAIFLSIRLAGGDLLKRAEMAAKRLWMPVVILFLALIALGYSQTTVFHHVITDVKVMPFGYLLLAVLISIPFLLRRGHNGWAFAMTSLTVVLSAIIIGLGGFPNIMVSTLNPAWNLTVQNASSSPYTLTVMSWIGLTIVPIVLIYQGWNYYVFRQRLKPNHAGHY
ncbi:cytochrome d ubiquinol oxidase subunit II [Dictyobacter arantiisoli]|uniref:Cytochrome c oxidase assembly protein n=1 Tax=Dictyobacter arantiisoli TaxID=2014874 RepID=A0A5A5T895_9CHLR|nr:cytochrome d ubiquinol oxidase subunit II [Dictyobacter arantiisoli]GCF07199.1 cytochrome c oxidase assembly protein [Dictyobacter arantiisoli]